MQAVLYTSKHVHMPHKSDAQCPFYFTNRIRVGKISCRLTSPADAGFLIPATVCAVCELWGFKAAFLT